MTRAIDLHTPLYEGSSRQRDFETIEPIGLDAISTLTAGIAHEINTPIQFISDNLIYLIKSIEGLTTSKSIDGNCTLGKSETLDWIDALTESLEGLQSISDIVVIMKTFASSSECDLETVDLNDMIKGIVKLCRGRDLDIVPIDLELCNELKPIVAAKGPIQQALTNIIVNAVDAVVTVNNPQAAILITSQMTSEIAEIVVSDQGVGIPRDIHHKIFLPFFTTKPPGKGTGNGLALACDIIAKRHGGSLTLCSVDGYQTSFLIRLPMDPKKNMTKEDMQDVKTD